MSRRRASFDWISASDEGDAARAAAEGAAWLAERAPPRDWDAVLAPLRDALQRLALHPRLRVDPAALAALGGLVGPAPSLEQVAAAVAALARRADELVPETGSRTRVDL